MSDDTIILRIDSIMNERTYCLLYMWFGGLLLLGNSCYGEDRVLFTKKTDTVTIEYTLPEHRIATSKRWDPLKSGFPKEFASMANKARSHLAKSKGIKEERLSLYSVLTLVYPDGSGNVPAFLGVGEPRVWFFVLDFLIHEPTAAEGRPRNLSVVMLAEGAIAEERKRENRKGVSSHY